MKRLASLAVLGIILLIAMIVVVVGLPIASGAEGLDVGFFVFLFIGLGLYWGLGALIVIRADGNAIGWLFAIAAALMATVFACYSLSFLLTSLEPPSPWGAWISLLAALLFTPAIILTLPAVAILFPTGALPGPRWRWPVVLLVSLVGIRSLAVLLLPGPMGDPENPVNPLTDWTQTFSPGVIEILRTIESIGTASILLACVLGIVAIVVRFRRSHGDQRQQLKWFLAAMVPASILLPLSLNEDVVSRFPLVSILSIATLPIAGVTIALAILRYRLYDIDRIISRTIAYGVITALLVGVFLLVNLGLQTVLSQVTRIDSLAVAGSTLLVAGLFTPVRRRVQRIVDRRFDRARYDGERMASAFSVRMRDAIDLQTLTHDLDATVREAIAPTDVGLWLRGSER